MHDILIVGCGLAGLINALLLAKESKLRIAILDSKTPDSNWSPENYDPRVYAITPATQKILQDLDAWPLIEAKRLSTYTRMQVWDERSGAELSFNHADLGVSRLGYILEENLIRSTLLQKAQEAENIDLLYPLQLKGLSHHPDYIELDCDSESATPLRGRLLIGADGAQSWVREKAGIELRIQSYEHHALIAQVQTEEDHQRTARQVFLSSSCHSRFSSHSRESGNLPRSDKEIPAFAGMTGTSGPLAFLPLNDPHQCSIVWSTKPEEAQRLLKMEEAEFQDILGKAFAFRLGKIQAISKRQTFPLYERHVESYVKARLALIGDAAHTLHPLAGQGINLGIADAACLAQLILEAVNKNRDYASLQNLRRFERARKSENFIMLSAVKMLKNLFASENKSLQSLRSQGLKAVNQLTPLKNLFASYAMGKT